MAGLLIDTHVFLFMALEPKRLSRLAQRRLEDAKTPKCLSIASVWEMAIKLSLGKLQLDDPLDDLIEHEAVKNDIALLPIRRAHVVAVKDLPLHHRDPFDRLLLCQASAEGLHLLSSDAVFDEYAVRRIW